jgi:hypothetical protein
VSAITPRAESCPSCFPFAWVHVGAHS